MLRYLDLVTRIHICTSITDRYANVCSALRSTGASITHHRSREELSEGVLAPLCLEQEDPVLDRGLCLLHITANGERIRNANVETRTLFFLFLALSRGKLSLPLLRARQNTDMR